MGTDPRRLRRLAAALACAAGLAGIWSPAARANGDPASDVLPTADVFYSTTPISQSVADTLARVVRSIHTAGLPLKVAVIATVQDLGLEGRFFNRPQAYADFLESEIAPTRPVPLLIVMAAGAATSKAPPGADRALAGLQLDASAEGLTRVAIDAAQRVAAGTGHPVPRVRAPVAEATARKRGGGGTPLWPFLVPAAVVVLAALLAARRGRAAAKDPPAGS